MMKVAVYQGENEIFIDFAKSIDLLAAGRIIADPLISHRLLLEEVEGGLETLGQEAKVMKILLKPRER